MADPAVTDDQRKRLEADLIAALLLQYFDRRHETLKALGEDDAVEVPSQLPATARKKIEGFAADRAEKVQAGINQYVQSALDDLPDDATDEERQQAVDDQRQEIEQYHDEVLMPYLARWADQSAVVDSYQETGNADKTLWAWSQSTNFVDDCTAAMDASPAPLEDLLAITKGPPPVHPRCGCSLEPAS